MELKLENLKYQDDALRSVIRVFDGTEKNTFDNACFKGIRSNISKLTPEQFAENKKAIAEENNISIDNLNLTNDPDITIEMETGTGKTLVYIKTIYELHSRYGFTKFIILVPSVAIRQGVIGTLKSFNSQLKKIYSIIPNAFVYDSKNLRNVTHFIESQNPQIMIMTLASFNSEEKILNQTQREDLFDNMPFIEALGKTNPIIIMDEPQEGMDTENSIKQIAKLNPLFKIRYSATHKFVKNRMYHLTPYDSYRQGLVKKIEVLTVTEKNDDAGLKIEISKIDNKSSEIRVKLKAWHHTAKLEFKETGWLSVRDKLDETTNNSGYKNFTLERIHKNSKTNTWGIRFSNGVEVFEKQAPANLENIWALQLEWLIRKHFIKAQNLTSKGIKCLSLVFIDRVANYMGTNPVIKNLFIEKYKSVYAEYNNGNTPTDQYLQSIQGYYFAQKSNGEYADTEGGLKEQSKIYELILKGKEELLSLDNPVQFIFSHSALGVGWDNPNVFNIATLNSSHSEIKKRQEIGRGLRICVNQAGQRIYDAAGSDEKNRINQLTIIPNESYESFVAQYQDEIKEVYGDTKAGAEISHTFRDKPIIQSDLRKSDTEDNKSQGSEKGIDFDEESLILKAINKINAITIPDYTMETNSYFVFENKTSTINTAKSRTKLQKAKFAPIAIIEELGENTGLSYTALLKILKGIKNLDQVVKNPPRFIYEASAIIEMCKIKGQ